MSRMIKEKNDIMAMAACIDFIEELFNQTRRRKVEAAT